jgi:hypothetical protein
MIQPDLFSAAPVATVYAVAAGRLDDRRLAADFCELTREALTAGQLAQVNDRNTAETNPAVDHVHDFTDGHELMARAIGRQLGDGWSWDDVPQAADIFSRARAAGYALQRVLVGCEYSGIVRDSFTALGHDATSADLEPSETPGKHHTGDVREIMADGYTLAVMHPPCTYLAASQAFRCTPKHDPTGWRQAQRDKALEFTADLFSAPIDSLALENPKGIITKQLGGRGYWTDRQMIQPYQYGHDASKQTILYLRGLDRLTPDPDDYVEPRVIEYRGKMVNRWANQSPCGADSRGPSKTRGKDRSRFFTGIARAMANQWAPVPAPAGA